jgi:transporter family protein
MQWIFYATGSAIFASLVAIFGKIGLKNIDSTLATTVRAIVMAIFLTIIAFSLKKFEGIETLAGTMGTYQKGSGDQKRVS